MSPAQYLAPSIFPCSLMIILSPYNLLLIVPKKVDTLWGDVRPANDLRKKEKEKTYRKIPPKNVEKIIPWDSVCINLVGSYVFTDYKSNDRIPNMMTFVDWATGWFEIAEVIDKTSARISQIIHNTWISRYQRYRKYILWQYE